MSLLNYENDSLQLTLGDVVQSFTEKDLQKSIPVFLEDVSGNTKDAVAEYQRLLANGLYESATTYRNEHPELDNVIFDSKKINSIWAYLSFAYMYAKNKRQQIVASLTEPSDQEIGDFWLKYDPSSTEQNVPLYVKDTATTYKQIWIASNFNFATENDINEIKENATLSNPDNVVNVENLASYSKVLNEQVQDFFQVGNDFRYAICDEIIAKKMGLSTKDIGKTYIYEKLRDSNIAFDTITKTVEISNISDFTFNESSDIWSLLIDVPYTFKKMIYVDFKLDITERVNKYKSVASENGGFKWSFDSVEEIIRSYNFDTIRTFSDYKDAIKSICFQSIGLSSPTAENQYAYDSEGYYTRNYTSDSIPTDAFSFEFRSDDTDWMYIDNGKTLRPIKFDFTFNIIYVKDIYSNVSYESLAGIPYVVLSQFTYEELRKINPANYLSTSCEDVSNVSCKTISKYSCNNLNEFGVRLKQ